VIHMGLVLSAIAIAYTEKITASIAPETPKK